MDSVFADGAVSPNDTSTDAVDRAHTGFVRWWRLRRFVVSRWTMSDVVDAYPIVVLAAMLGLVAVAVVADRLGLSHIGRPTAWALLVLCGHAALVATQIANLFVPDVTVSSSEEDLVAWNTVFCHAMLPYILIAFAIGLRRFRTRSTVGVAYLLIAAIAFTECEYVYIARLVCLGGPG